MVRTAENVFNHLLVDSLVDSLHYDSNPYTMAGKNDDSVEDGYDGIESNSKKPEPEKHIDFLIYDIEGKDAQSIMSRDAPRRPILMKSAFCHLKTVKAIVVVHFKNYFGKDNIHRVSISFWLANSSRYNIKSIGGELIAKEP